MTVAAWFVACLVSGLTCTVAQADEAAPVRTLAGITEYRLDNGLQVLLMPVAGSGRTFVTVTYKVGSRMEAQQEAGMAHLLEHVTFRGTRDAGGVSIDVGAELKKLNVSYNGSTTFDRTNYTDNFSASDALLKQVLALEAQRMSDARLDQADFEKEKPIVLNEMGLRGDDIGRQMLEGLESGAFTQHSYRRPVIGYTSDIENLSLPTLRTFYEKYYRPDNAVLMIAGEFDPAQALAAVTADFAAKARPATPVPEPSLTEPAQAAPRLVTLHARETAVAVAYHVPALASPDAAAVIVSGMLLSSIKTDLTRDPTRVGTQVRFALWSHDPFVAALVLPLPRTKSNDADARAKLADDAKGWASDLERASFSSHADQNHIIIMIEQARSEVNQALLSPGAASALISDAVGAGDWRLAFKLQEALAKLKPAAVERAIADYVRPENRTLAIGVTDPAISSASVQEQPLTGISSWFSKPVAVAAVKDASATVGEIKTPTAGASAGAAFETDPAQIDHETRRVKLPSGILLAMLNRQSANDRITIDMTFRWGPAQRMVGEPGWRALGNELLEAGSDGLTRLSAEQIGFLKAKLQAEIGIRAGPQGLGVGMTVPRQYFAPALQLVRDLLRDADLPNDDFKRIKGRTVTALGSAIHGASWAPELARQHRMKALGLQWGDAAYTLSSREQQDIWKKLDIDAVEGFRKHYWSANEMQVSAVGPLPDGLMGMIENYFGDWKKPTAPPFEREVMSFKPEDGARFVSTRRAGATGDEGAQGSAHISWRQGFALNEAEPEAMAMNMAARILVGSGTGGSRILDRLRGRDAISYNASYALYIPQYGNDAALSFTATASPESALRAEADIREEIDRLLKEGITPAELATARSQYLDARRSQTSSDAGLAGALLAGFDRHEGLAPLRARQDAALQALSVDSVNAAMRKLLLPDHWVVVITGAEAGTDAAKAQ